MGEALISKPWQGRVLTGSALLVLAGVTALVLLSMRLAQEPGERLAAARAQAGDQAAQITEGIGSRLKAIVPPVEALAADLASGALSRAEVGQRLERDFALGEGPDILEIGVAYAADSAERQDAPHYGFKQGELQQFQLEQSYDYLDAEWYRDALARRTNWSEPYLGQATGSWAAGYARAFEREGEVAGVARVNFSLTEIHRRTALGSNGALQAIGQTGYALLLSEKNRIIAHPIDALIGRSTAEVEAKHPILGVVSRLEGRQGSFRDPVTGEPFLIFVDRLPAVGWTAAVVFNQRDVLERNRFQRDYELLIFAAVMLLLPLALIVLRAHRATDRAVWRFALASSLIFCAAIVATWSLNLRRGGRVIADDIRVVDEAGAEALIDAHDFPPSARHVPTGVFVQSLRFTSANNVVLTGYVWQRSSGTNSPPGVVLPEAEEISITPAGENLWYFETTLRQQFNYSRYPFDREDVWIRLWPADLGHLTGATTLVPDFAGYSDRRFDDKPGLEADFVLEGWDVTGSHFSYRENTYNANFGLDPELTGRSTLELYFNIGLKRDFMGPFIADFIPIIVVAFLVFKVLMSSTRREASIGLFGFSASAVLGYCAALFFVLIVSHIHLRETLQTSGIIYIEWFYFTMYFAILAVSTNALVFASDARAPLIHFRDNILVKQAFWPLLTGLLFVVTVVVFH